MKTKKEIKSWSISPENSVTFFKKMLSHLSFRVRGQQLEFFLKIFKPTPKLTVLDVGVTPNEELVDSNFFEQKYPYLQKVTAVSIEDCRGLFRKKYPKVRFAQVKSNKPLPFARGSFDIVVSWATLEHVGNENKQKFFLNELLRVGKNVFVTTPDRRCFFEPHTGFIFLHWLPRKYFSFFCRLAGKKFLSSEENLRPLDRKDIKKMLPNSRKIKILPFKLIKVIPSHLILVKREGNDV